VTPPGGAGHDNPFISSYASEWGSFLAAVRGQAEARSLDDQILLHKVMDAIYRSAREGRTVEIG
jgi:predicted dehydrogenase